MATKEDLQKKLISIENICQEEYYRMDEFEDCDIPVWDNYCANAMDLFCKAESEEEKQEVIDSICVEDFVDWLTC